jgi:ABC-type transport system substrate-binding protein
LQQEFVPNVQSPQSDLAQARRLIEKHGYWRHKGELEDAEQAQRGAKAKV